MELLYQSYVAAYTEFADARLAEASSYRQIITFADQLTQMADELTGRLSTDFAKSQLQGELFAIGKSYVKKFADKFRPCYSIELVHS